MAYTINLTFAFGAGNTGLTLNGKLFDATGAQVGSTITSGFVEMGTGGSYSYLATIPDGQAGTFVAYKSTDATVSACVGVNPQECENTDAKTTTRMATYTQPSGFLVATFPSSVASPTNITAGTMTTVTNLTNAPSAGDFTATMKTSLNAASPIATLADGAITDAKFSFTADPMALPSGPVSWLQWLAARMGLRRTKKDDGADTIAVYKADATTVWTTNAYVVSGENEDVEAAS